VKEQKNLLFTQTAMGNTQNQDQAANRNWVCCKKQDIK